MPNYYFFIKIHIKYQKKLNNELYFEQDGASAHTSRTNKIVIKKLFGKNALIQNLPNSPDFAYPIEYI